MNELATLTSPTTLELPEEIAIRFQPKDQFYTWLEGDTVILKRITPVSIFDVLEKSPPGEPMAMEEINEIVHEVRRQMRQGA